MDPNAEVSGSHRTLSVTCHSGHSLSNACISTTCLSDDSKQPL